MTEADARRKERRQEAIQMRLKREARLKAEFAKLPASVKRRKVRRYGRSKAKLHIDEYLQKVEQVERIDPSLQSKLPPMFFPSTWPSDSSIEPEVEKEIKPDVVETPKEAPETVEEPVIEEEPIVKEEPVVVEPPEVEVETTSAVKPVVPARKLFRKEGFPIDVLFLSPSDYACVGHLYAESLKSVGVKAVAIADKPSTWRAPGDQGTVGTKAAVIEAVKKTHILVYMHSCYQPFPAEIMGGKRLIAFHGGTRYRRAFKKLNERFNPIVEQCFIQTGELLGKGAKNARWLLPPIDTEDLKPNYTYRSDGKLVIGHFSSHVGGPGTKQYYSKGSGVIDSVMDVLKKGKFGQKFIYTSRNPSILTWREHLRRLGECDIYIESLSQGQKEHVNKHDWSLTALEACAVGCITVTNFLHEERYKKEYGEHGLIVTNNAAQLKEAMTKLLQLDQEEILALKLKARLWVEEMHSFKAIGQRLKSMLET